LNILVGLSSGDFLRFGVEAKTIVTVCLADELVEDWDVFELFNFDLKDMLNLLVRLAWIFGVIMVIFVPVASFLISVLIGPFLL
jgi:hypothetical protein